MTTSARPAGDPPASSGVAHPAGGGSFLALGGAADSRAAAAPPEAVEAAAGFGAERRALAGDFAAEGRDAVDFAAEAPNFEALDRAADFRVEARDFVPDFAEDFAGDFAAEEVDFALVDFAAEPAALADFAADRVPFVAFADDPVDFAAEAVALEAVFFEDLDAEPFDFAVDEAFVFFAAEEPPDVFADFAAEAVAFDPVDFAADEVAFDPPDFFAAEAVAFEPPDVFAEEAVAFEPPDLFAAGDPVERDLALAERDFAAAPPALPDLFAPLDAVLVAAGADPESSARAARDELAPSRALPSRLLERRTGRDRGRLEKTSESSAIG